MENCKDKIKEKKPLTLKKLVIRRIIFLIIFLAISAGITSYLVIKKPFDDSETVSKTEKKSSSEEKIDEESKKEHFTLIDLENDTFDYNGLKVNEITETYEGYDYVTYFQIDGLKNKTVQDKINSNLNYDLKKAITDAINEGFIKNNTLIVSPTYGSSFANTLSLSYTISSYIYDDETEEYSWEKYITENYDLNTGERIQIQDIFTDDTLGSEIFDSNFYNEFVQNYPEIIFDEYTGYCQITDYNDIEEAILDLILNFNNGVDIPFYFDEQTVTILNGYARIFYEDHLDYVAIYNNFKSSENLFTNQYNAIKNIPVLVKRSQATYQKIEESDNYYIDVTLNDFSDSDISETLLNSAIAYIENDIEEMKKEANNSNKFIIYNCSYQISVNYLDEINNTYSFYITRAKMETTQTTFKNELKEQIIKVFRDPVRVYSGEARLYDNLFYSYLYDNYEEIEKDWNQSFSTLYIDNIGNIIQKDSNSTIWETED